MEAHIEEDQTGPRLPSEVKEGMERSEDKGRGREEEGRRGAEGGGGRHKVRGREEGSISGSFFQLRISLGWQINHLFVSLSFFVFWVVNTQLNHWTK